jgi:membrane protease YdiL (CAAX protease family)
MVTDMKAALPKPLPQPWRLPAVSPADCASEGATERRSPLRFFLLVVALSIPFWLLGGLTGWQLLPGLPVAALMFICPGAAALILVQRENGTTGMARLLRRSFDLDKIMAKPGYLSVLLLMPAVTALAFAVQRLTGTPVPAPQIAVLPVLLLSVGFFIGALGEELGWSGYAIDPMQARWGTLGASILLGLMWAVFHYIGLAQAHRSVEWIAWWSLGTVTQRMIMVWLYNQTGRSIFAVTLFHMTGNLGWQLYPVHGSYFDPRVTGIITALVAVVVVFAGGLRSARAARGLGRSIC